MTAAETYAALVDAFDAQRARIHGDRLPEDPWANRASGFRHDPRRELTGNISVLASYVRPEDTLIDAGGGAGRLSLPLALRCRRVINVDASPAMLKEFQESAAEAGIQNATSINSNWIDARDVQGDVVATCSVTYFVRRIVPFVESLVSAARRRVMITVWSVPPPNQSAPVFQLVYGEEQALTPGHRELLPVLWEMGILPDVHVMGNRNPNVEPSGSREEAISSAMQGRWLLPADRDRAQRLIEANFDMLYAEREGGFLPLWRQPSRELLITWETGRDR